MSSAKRVRRTAEGAAPASAAKSPSASIAEPASSSKRQSNNVHGQRHPLPREDHSPEEDDDALAPPLLQRTRSSSTSAAVSVDRMKELSLPLATRIGELHSSDARRQRVTRLAKAMNEVLDCLGEDSSREGLLDTPVRAAEALLFWTRGYEQTLLDVVNGAIFEENHNEMVVVMDIDVSSLCEHHLAPFSGKAHVGYIPDGRVIGISKLARIVEMFARRLQVQERLTSQIADSIVEILKPRGVAVIIECSHSCMSSRGVLKPGSVTKTSSVRGVFKADPRTRQEFFSHVYRSG